MCRHGRPSRRLVRRCAMFGYPFPVLVSENWTTVLDFAAPTVAVIVGLFIYFLKSRIDHRQWTNQKVIERRLDVIDRMSTKINAIYCYFTWIGRWKEHTPDKIVEMKRSLDD